MIWYLAHPVGAATAREVSANIQRALRWLAWVRREEPKACVIAPWIAAILAGEDDADPKQRERGLVDAELVASVCDGIVLCGGRVSSGMQREITAVTRAGGQVVDLTFLGDEPPSAARLDELFAASERQCAPCESLFDLGQRAWEAP